MSETLNEATTDPYKDFAVFLTPLPKFYEIYTKMLDHWQKNRYFHDLLVVKGCLSVELRMPPPSDDDFHTTIGSTILYHSIVQQRLDPETGEHLCCLECNRGEIRGVKYAREIMKSEDWQFVVSSRITPLRGHMVGETMIWTHTEKGMEKIKSVALSIRDAGEMRRLLLAGVL